MPVEIQIIDSHTGGEPTRTIVKGGPDLGKGNMAERRNIFARDFDHVRRSLILEPRGSSVMVGALLCEPVDPENTAGVIFFNNTGYLGMCGHGVIGLIVTLYHMKKIPLGKHRIETPVGLVSVELLSANKAQIENVESFRFAKDIAVEVPDIGKVIGDIAWGGNWFYLVKSHNQILDVRHCEQLLQFTWQIKEALAEQQIRGSYDAIIDHIELFSDDVDRDKADSKNFVLCPGREYDRSPCGTGTSAKLACLFEDGLLQEGQIWRQQSIIGSIFEGHIQRQKNKLVPFVTGSAFVTLESRVLLDNKDNYRFGI